MRMATCRPWMSASLAASSSSAASGSGSCSPAATAPPSVRARRRRLCRDARRGFVPDMTAIVRPSCPARDGRARGPRPAGDLGQREHGHHWAAARSSRPRRTSHGSTLVIVSSSIAVRDRPRSGGEPSAEDDEPALDERAHEGEVLVPPTLLGRRPRVVPARSPSRMTAKSEPRVMPLSGSCESMTCPSMTCLLTVLGLHDLILLEARGRWHHPEVGTGGDLQAAGRA
jgi:hypothetical protein